MYAHTGFAEAIRNIVFELYYKGCELSTVSHNGLSKNILRDPKGRIVYQYNRAQFKNAWPKVHIIMTIPMGVKPKNGGYRIGHVMFETQQTPKKYAESLMHYTDELWVPSTFNKKNFAEAGYTKPIFVMPLGVDTDLYNPHKVKPLEIGAHGKFVFLFIAGWSERKGVSRLVEAYAKAFSANDNTLLYMKGSWYPEVNAQKDVQDILNKICGDDKPDVRIDFGVYDNFTLPRLYKACDCFVLPSIGEGWGLPYTEAMSMAMPTIGTRATSQVDFMNDDNSFLIDVEKYAPEPRVHWITPDYKDGVFAIPSVEHLQKLLRQVYEDRELAKKRGRQARQDMIKKYTWKKSVAKIYKRLKKLEAIL